MVKIAQPRGYADVSLSDRWRSAGEMRPGPTCSTISAACGAFHFTTLPQLRAAKSPAMRARRDRALRRRVRREPCHEPSTGRSGPLHKSRFCWLFRYGRTKNPHHAISLWVHALQHVRACKHRSSSVGRQNPSRYCGHGPSASDHVFRIKRIYITVNHLVVLSYRHIDARAAFSIG